MPKMQAYDDFVDRVYEQDFYLMINPLELFLCVTLCWFILGVIGWLLLLRDSKYLTGLFLLGTVGSAVLFIGSGFALGQSGSLAILSLGIPDYPLHFAADPLSVFFILLLATASLGTGLFSSQYFKHVSRRRQAIQFLLYHWFLASMTLIFLAADAYGFLLAWEFMAITSYLMIVTTHSSPETLGAGFIYFLITHLGALFLFVGFALMVQGAHDYTFTALREVQLSPWVNLVIFISILIGFGAKAGILPFHIWAPEAYSAAPTPITALMSGVMLKTATYGLIRFIFDLLSQPILNCGLAMLILGMGTAFYCVIMAAMQTEMKRLLAYSSIENSGFIFAAIGLALIFQASSQPLMAALALTAALFHAFNHAVFKSLLFLGAGSVLHATGERNVGKLGGLIRKMPWVAFFVLIGMLTVSGVPPFGGFVSEWLLLQTFLFSSKVEPLYISMLLSVIVGVFALAIGLGAYVMVKFYGITFLGVPREESLTQACDPPLLERCGLGWLAAGCILLGIFPVTLLGFLKHVMSGLLGESAASLFAQDSLFFIIPKEIERSSYSPFILVMILIITITLLSLFIHRLSPHKARRAPAWDCGYPSHHPKLQDTAEGFGQPIKHIFKSFIHLKLMSPSPSDRHPQYYMKAEDRFWYLLYLPGLRVLMAIGRMITKVQDGRINHYLLYSFVTLLVLLWWTL